jgi:hypothetical protein
MLEAELMQVESSLDGSVGTDSPTGHTALHSALQEDTKGIC